VEPDVPFEVRVMNRDRYLLVFNKPHFLATIPRGSYVARSVLVRLRRDLDLPDLSPAHRLDRVTAGVLLLTLRPQVRGAYQELFARREVRKTYEAVAPWDPALDLPTTVRSRIVKHRGVMRAEEVDGEPNAQSRVDVVEADPARGLARYRLEPHSGKTHQPRQAGGGEGALDVGDRLAEVRPPLGVHGHDEAGPQQPRDLGDPGAVERERRALEDRRDACGARADGRDVDGTEPGGGAADGPRRRVVARQVDAGEPGAVEHEPGDVAEHALGAPGAVARGD